MHEPFVSPPSPPYSMITFPRRNPQMLVVDHLCHDSVIKVEMNDHYNQQAEAIKVKVDDFYQPRAKLSPTSISMSIPKRMPAPVPEKQEVDSAQDQYTLPSPSFPHLPSLLALTSLTVNSLAINTCLPPTFQGRKRDRMGTVFIPSPSSSSTPPYPTRRHQYRQQVV